MFKRYPLLISSLLLLLAGCNSTDGADEPTAPVRIALQCENGASIRPFSLADGTRTWILPDDPASTGWSPEDRIVVWATSEQTGATPIDGLSFSLAHYGTDYTTAVFCATAQPMPAGQYAYTAVSPEPAEREGTRVTYRLPARQTGAYDATDCDILAADPLADRELPLFESFADLVATPATHRLHFRHKCHALRIEIPSGRNLFGSPVTRLQIDFPGDAVGDVSFDAATPEAEMTLARGERSVTLELATPLTDDAGSCAWVFIAPSRQTGELSFTAYNAAGHRSTAIAVPIDNRFEAGHVTPVTLTVPERYRRICHLDLSVEDFSRLGEAPERITVEAPEGATFLDGSSSVTFMTDEENRYTLDFDTDEAGEILRNAPLTIVYETENAIVRDRIQLDTFPAEGRKEVSLTLPWLFSEDFSALAEEFHIGDEHSAANAGNKVGTLPIEGGGWTGGRVGGTAGTSIRLAAHREMLARYHARVDSAPLAVLKAGASVRLAVTFDYGMDRQEGGLGTKPQVGQTCYMGYTTNPAALNSGNTEGTYPENFYLKETGASWNSLPHTRTCTIEGCGATTRLSWRTETDSKSGTTNSTCWLYIDNIRVSIVK